MSKLKQNTSITEIMSLSPFTLNKLSKISDAANLFEEQNVHHLPVVNGDRLIGMFSKSDLMELDYSESLGQDKREVLATLDHSKTVEEVMSKDLVTLTNSETVYDAAKKLTNGSFHSLPIVSEDGSLVGIVTSTDVIRFYAELH